jgi:hypothetical protein
MLKLMFIEKHPPSTKLIFTSILKITYFVVELLVLLTIKLKLILLYNIII